MVQNLEQYGRSLGIAFQISDDLLDILGSEEITGKSLGSDLRKQKLTLPLIHLLAQSRPPETARIRTLLRNPGKDSRLEIVDLLAQSDAIEYARRRADEFVHRRGITILAHIETLYRVLALKEVVRQDFGGFGLPNTGGPEDEK